MKRHYRVLSLFLSILLILPSMMFPSIAAGGSYNIKWSAADPAENTGSYQPTYEKIQPSDTSWPTIMMGRQNDPLQHAVAYGPTYTSSNYDAVQSLMPKNLALGQVVPFILEIKVSGTTTPENGVIFIEPYWLTKTTPGDDFGFDPAYKVIAAFVDIGDAGTVDPGGNATVTEVNSTVSGVGTKNETIEGKIKVEGLDDGDNIIVEVWVVLKKSIDNKVTGNVQTGLIKAYTSDNSTINVGNQTVPLLQSGSFFTEKADLSIIKSDAPDPVIGGDTLTYSITVTNNSADTVANGILVKDTLDPNVTFVSASDGGTHSAGVVTWPEFALAPGDSEVFTLTVTVQTGAPTELFPGTSADGRGGPTAPPAGTFDLNNKVEVSAITEDSVLGNNVYHQPTNVVIRQVPSLAINKVTVFGEQSGDGLSFPSGSAIKWRYTVTNTGNVPLTGVAVTDNMLSVNPVYVSGDANDDDILDLTEAWIFEASGVAITGSYNNTGTADSNESGPASDTSSYFGTSAGLNINKVTVFGDQSGDGLNIPVGSTIKWRYTITNTGNVPLTVITVTDNMPGVTPVKVSGDTNNDNKLDPSETWIYEASGTAIAGAYSNIGTADSSETGPATDPSNYFGVRTGIAIDKVTVFGEQSGDGLFIPKDSAIKWRYTVTNTGNIPLTGVSVTDNMPGVSPVRVSGDTNEDGKLDLSETWIYEASGTAVAGSYSNIGTADSNETGSVTDASNYFGTTIGISINKVTVFGNDDGDGLNIPEGSAIKWRYTVSNTGNIPLTGVTVTDNMPGVTPLPVSGDTNEDGKLDPSETWIYEASGTAIAGAYSNIGTADSNETGPATDPSNYFGVKTGIAIDKVTIYNQQIGDGLSIPEGSAIMWRYTVTNEGNVPLSGITVTDDQPGVSPVYVSGDTNSDGKLDVSETWIYEASGVAIKGAYSNIGTADSTETGPATDTSSYFGTLTKLAVDKVTVYGNLADDGLTIPAGSAIKWRYTVTNTGNVPLSGIVVTDNMPGVNPIYISGDTNDNEMLDTTEAWIFEAAGNAIAGNYNNTGTASSTETGPASDTSNYFGENPRISIRKDTVHGQNVGDGLSILAGSAIKWRYTVTNIGNVPLSGITVTDNKPGVTPVYVSGDINENGRLDLTEIWIFEASGTAISGAYSNIGTADSVESTPATDASNYTGYNDSPPPPPPPPSLGSIRLNKFLDTDDNGTWNTGEGAMNNVEFGLYDANKVFIRSQNTNIEGFTVFTGLNFGTYYLKELTPGYRLTTGNFGTDGFSTPIVVNSTAQVTFDAGNVRIVIDSPPPVVEEVEEIIEEAPPLATPLPDTGEIPPYIAYSLGSLLILAGLFIKRKF